MGIENYLLTAVLRGVLAQRLVRRLCEACRRVAPAAPELVRRFRLDERARATGGGAGAPNERARGTGVGAGGPMLWHAVGCSACRGTGFRGRFAIAEFLVPDAETEKLIFAQAEHSAIERAAVAAGMYPMFDAGLDAALNGETTIEELVRSVRAEA